MRDLGSRFLVGAFPVEPAHAPLVPLKRAQARMIGGTSPWNLAAASPWNEPMDGLSEANYKFTLPK
ncbi:MAG: hypothetical protein RJS98_08395 [Rhodospirillaceae bacterium]